jgi:hypothetical protein
VPPTPPKLSTLEIVALSYLLLAVATGGAAVVHALRARRRPGESLDGFDRVVLVLTGLAVGALWVLFAPFYVAGWSRDRLPKHLASLRRRMRRPARVVGEEALQPATPGAGPTGVSR